MHRRLTLLAGAAVLATAPALAQTQQPGGAAPTTAPAPARTAGQAEAVSTEEFIRLATMSDRFEIASSRIVSEKSQNQQVKEFAQRMIRDHERTTQERLKLVQQIPGAGAGPATPLPQGREAQGSPRSAPITNAQGGPQPEGLDEEHTAMLQQLQQASGAELDRLYARQQVTSHQKAVDMVRNYSQAGDNAQLKRFAADILPDLEQHLQMAQRLVQSVQG